MNKINLLIGIAGFILFIILLTMGVYLNAVGIFLIAAGFVVASENPFSNNVSREEVPKIRQIMSVLLKIAGVLVIVLILLQRMFL